MTAFYLKCGWRIRKVGGQRLSALIFPLLLLLPFLRWCHWWPPYILGPVERKQSGNKFPPSWHDGFVLSLTRFCSLSTLPDVCEAPFIFASQRQGHVALDNFAEISPDWVSVHICFPIHRFTTIMARTSRVHVITLRSEKTKMKVSFRRRSIQMENCLRLQVKVAVGV